MKNVLPNFLRLTLLLTCLAWLGGAHAAVAVGDDDIEVKVSVDGEDVRVDVNFLVDAKPREAWAVLTDFEHMPDFVANLSSSKVLSRGRNALTVEQKGKAGSGPVSFDFSSVREIKLLPFERIQSHMISGNMKKLEGVTELVDEAGKTRVRYHSDAVSETWIPPVVGRGFIESQTREQFSQMRDEIMRRKQSGSGR